MLTKEEKSRFFTEMHRVLGLVKQSGFTSAVVAGGAIRDLYHNKRPRDVDIFVWDPNYSNESTIFGKKEFLSSKEPITLVGQDDKWRTALGLASTDVILQLFGSDSAYNNEGNITHVWDIHIGVGNFQIITTKLPPITHVENNFNIGLCKCYYDGNTICYTDDFIRDDLNETLTIVNQNMSEGDIIRTIEEHIPRIQTRYPYDVVNPFWDEHPDDGWW